LILWLENKKKWIDHQKMQNDQRLEQIQENWRKDGFSEEDISKMDRSYRVAAGMTFYAIVIGLPLWFYHWWSSRGEEAGGLDKDGE
jgi:hypothetical protein